MSSTKTDSRIHRGWPFARSIAARLTGWYAASAFGMILAVSGYLYWALEQNLDREDDEFLVDYVSILRVLFKEHSEDTSALKQEVEWETGARQHAKAYARILSTDGQPLLESPGIPTALGPGAFPPPAPEDQRTGSPVTIWTDSGDEFRLLSAMASVGTTAGEARIIQVAIDRSEEKTLLADFRKRALSVLGVSFFLCIMVGYRIAKQGIRPVEDMSRAIQRIHSRSLDRRIETTSLPTELSDLAAAFNETLARLQVAFEQLSSFSADIAHELRTPVNNMRGEMEVALSRSRAAEEYRDALVSSLEEVERLSRIIESLLFLARAENPERGIHREPVDVTRELSAVRDFYEAAAAEVGIRLDVSNGETVVANLDRTLIQRALGNLVENALTYTKKGGAITLSAASDPGAVRIEVADTGCGIAGEHIPRIFDRLYRVDSSRTSSTGGTGLGLAIVKSIATLHDGTVGVRSEVGRGTIVHLELPRK